MLVSVRLAAQCHSVPVNSDVMSHTKRLSLGWSDCIAALLYFLAISVLAAPASGAPPQDGLVREKAEVKRLESEQARMLRELKRTLASLPGDPPPSPGESEEVRQRREKNAELSRLLAEIERRMEAEKQERKPLSDPSNAAYREYYERLVSRIEAEATARAPVQKRVSLRGSLVLVLGIGANGELEKVSAERATSKDLAEFVVALVRQLAPFERFSEEIKGRADHIEIRASFKYGGG